MQIDADSTLYDFPSFAELNRYLDAVRAKYSQGTDVNDTDAAALSFACGVAIGMDYSSEGSGAAPCAVRDGLLGKLGFHSADMFGGLSADSCRVLQENMINQLPALMGICTPDGYMGHLVVCDGYNTNDEYHLNFGWGSDHPDKMTEVWYHLPTDILSRRNVISETILNIQPNKPALEADPASMSFHSAPGEESAPQSLRLANNVAGVQVHSISSPDGFLIARAGGQFSNRLGSFTIQRAGEGATISVKFRPERAGGYYGTLVIRVWRWKHEVRHSERMVVRRRDPDRGRERVWRVVAGPIAIFRHGEYPGAAEGESWRLSPASKSSLRGRTA